MSINYLRECTFEEGSDPEGLQGNQFYREKFRTILHHMDIGTKLPILKQKINDKKEEIFCAVRNRDDNDDNIFDRLCVYICVDLTEIFNEVESLTIEYKKQLIEGCLWLEENTHSNDDESDKKYKLTKIYEIICIFNIIYYNKNTVFKIEPYDEPNTTILLICKDIDSIIEIINNGITKLEEINYKLREYIALYLKVNDPPVSEDNEEEGFKYT
jgi:hypothetical protein